jgi:hypothetical protein
VGLTERIWKRRPMRCTMQFIKEREKPNSLDRMHASGERIEQEPMHPDDFDAPLAWVTAKRFHEFVLEKPFAEKPVYYRIMG